MLWVPQKGRVLTQHMFGQTASINWGGDVVTGASSSVKGTALELIASTNFDAYWIEIYAQQYGTNGVASQGAMDILIGSATEDILIPNLLMGYCTGGVTSESGVGKSWAFPLYIPAGSRIACQAAGARLSTIVQVAITLRGGSGLPPFRVGRKVTTYGMGTVPDGTAITPGINGAQGSFTQIVAATSDDHFAFMPSFQISGDNAVNGRHYMVGMGVGAATEDVVGEWMYIASSNEQMAGAYPNYPMFLDVPSGTRLALRASNSGTNESAYNAVIHAVS